MRPTTVTQQLRLGLVWAWALASIACGNNPTAVQLVLTADPDLAPATDVADQVSFLQVIVDSAEGLLGVGAAGATNGGVAIDWDEDGQLEVVFEAHTDNSELPVLEIGLEDNADRELNYRVLGFASDDRIEKEEARGGVTAACPTGDACKLGTPFNLRAHARRPKVVLALPTDGAYPPDSLASITIMFSNTVDEASLASRVVLTGPSGTVGTTPVLQTMVYNTPDGHQELRSLLTLEIDEVLDEGDHAIEVSPGIMSTQGRYFDQEPSTAVEDGFVSHFHNTLAVGGGGPCDQCPSGYACETIGSGCVPLLDCASGCAQGFVCEPDQQLCVEDCRAFGSCHDSGQSCNQSTGLCD